MGLAFDKMFNQPPFGPKCDPECTPNPSRGNICCCTLNIMAGGAAVASGGVSV